MQGLPAAAAGLFRFLNEESVDYCVLGDARGLPARPSATAINCSSSTGPSCRRGPKAIC
jgi:hypothetical protein